MKFVVVGTRQGKKAFDWLTMFRWAVFQFVAVTLVLLIFTTITGLPYDESAHWIDRVQNRHILKLSLSGGLGAVIGLLISQWMRFKSTPADKLPPLD